MESESRKVRISPKAKNLTDFRTYADFRTKQSTENQPII